MLLAGCKGDGSEDTEETDADTDTDTDSDSDSDTDTDADCISDASFAAIGAHVDDLGQSATLLLGHAGTREAVGAFLFPGYVGLTAQYATLFEACAEPTLFDEWCDPSEEGGDPELCWRLECTGEGAGNITHGRLASPPFEIDGYVFDSATTDTEWVEATDEVITTLASAAVSPEGVDFSLSGTSTLTPDGTLVLVESYPGLVSGGAELNATLDLDATAITGDLRSGSTVLAVFDGHDLVPTGDCP